jgi:hypothetical protein
LVKKLLLASALMLAVFPGCADAETADEQTCGIFYMKDRPEDKADYKRCVARLAGGDEDYRNYLACAREDGGKLDDDGKPQCGFEPPVKPKPVAFRPWRQVWQCNDIRIVEFSNRQGLIEYDLGGTIWGGSQFARDLNRDMLFFNGRPCLKVAR